MPKLRLRLLLPVVVAVLVLSAGCGGGAGGSGGSTGTGGMGGGGSCPTSSATGTLSLRFAGSPLDKGLATLPPGTDEITINSDVTLPAGAHDVWAYTIAGDESPFRMAYEPTVATQTACVRAGQQTIVTVNYTLVQTSGLLWLGASNNPTTSTMFGYGAASVASTGSAAALVAANTFGSGGFTFDPSGNMWVIGGTTADDQVARYPSRLFDSDGAKTPDIVINSFGSSIPGARVLAFDIQGNLWVSVVAENKVVKIAADDLSTAAPTASVAMSGIDAPAGLAFDFAGNLWVAANGSSTIMRIDASHHGTSGSGADLTITAMRPSPVIGTLTYPLGIAFDGSGNLWVNYDGILARLTPTDLSGTGLKTITPAVQIVLDVLALPTGIAFDETGGLWLAYSGGKFARLAASQLTASGTIAPQILITSSDIGSADWFAIYPAPAFTPLAHALP
jgi:sugar lactone lactonase YvrE